MDDQSARIKFTTPSKDGFYRAENEGRPANASAGGKSFKKIMEKEKEGDNQDEVADSGEITTSGKGTLVRNETSSATPSPFSMFGQTKNAEEAVVEGNAWTPGSPSDLFAASNKVKKSPLPAKGDTEMAAAQGTHTPVKPTKEDQSAPIDLDDPSEADALSWATKAADAKAQPTRVNPEEIAQASDINQPKSKNSDSANLFNREQPDLSYVNPLMAMQPASISPVADTTAPKQPFPAQNLQELVNRLVKEISVLTDSGKNETTVTLDHPPQFNGVRIVLTGFENAPKEFNVRFENLTQVAQNIMDQQQNRADLLSNLERKGYNVHIFVTTTYNEGSPIVVADTPAQQNPREDNENKGQQKGKNRRDEDNKG